MLDFLPSCLRRHKKKLIFLGGVIGGITFFNTYLKRKFIEWETRSRAEICNKIKKTDHFEKTMNTCDTVSMSFTTNIRDNIKAKVEVDEIVKKLQGNPPNKIQFWEQLKISVFTEVIGEMYATSLLCILLKVQMSILSGYNFATRNTSANVTEQQQYMKHISNFMESGISSLLEHVKQACVRQFKSRSLSEPLLFRDIEDIIDDILKDVSLNDLEILPGVSCLLMSSSSENDSFLNDISAETKDVLQCEDFKTVLDACVRCGTSLIRDQLMECYSILSSQKEFTNVHAFETPLAKLIPVVHNLYVNDEPYGKGALALKVTKLDELNKFAANIYEAFSQ